MNIQQTSQNPLIQILSNILTTDVTLRIESENQINYLSQNLSQFLISISQILSEENERKEIRQLSATLIKNIISKPGYIQKYFEIEPEIKQQIKNNILSTLASSILEIRKAAALAVAGICKIELPKKQWNNIFHILCNTSQNEDLNIQLSSLTTLEYIYEEISIKDIDIDTKAKLLNTYTFLLNKKKSDIELTLAALKSIKKFLPFISDFIYNKESAMKFFGLIHGKVMDKTSEKIRQEGIKIFIEISRLYYDYLDCYIINIYNFSEKILKDDIDENKIWILNLWFFLGNEEDYRINYLKNKKQSQYFLQKYYDELSNICLDILSAINYNEEEDENNLIYSSSQLLYIMSKVCDFNFIQKMIKYIEQNINSEKEKNQYLALYVFNNIISTVHKNKFYLVVKDSLGIISEILLKNKIQSYFKILASKIMNNITEEYGKELKNDAINFSKVMQLFSTLININNINNLEKEVLYYIIISINNLCKKVEWNESDENNILSIYIPDLSESIGKSLTNLSYYDTQFNITKMFFSLLGTLGERSALNIKEYMIGIFKFLVSLFESTLITNNNENQNIQFKFQEYISNCLIGFLTTGKADKSLIGNLLSSLIKSFNKRDIYEEGLTLIGSIAFFTQEDFITVMDLISPYLIKGLQSMDSPSICMSSILCVSDIIRGLGIKNNYINEFFPLIMKILSDNTIDRNLKPICFNIISDIYLSCPNEAFKYFQEVMKLLGEAIQATQVKLDENDEKENLEHFIDLREHILETLNCVYYAVREINKTKEFIPYVVCIVNYINFISNDFTDSLDIIKDGLFLLADFCEAYGNDIKSILDIENIKTMIKKIERDKIEGKDKTTIDRLNWAKIAISGIFN